MSIASEAKLRQLATNIIGENLVAERGCFTFPNDSGEVIRDVPFVYCPNLIAKVADMVEQHKRYVILHIQKINHYSQTCRAPDGLTWHDGAIPDDELWIKIGGDKGRGSFKFNLQLINTKTPNSVKSTSLVSVFKAGDSTSNLHTALDMYQEHIKEIQGMQIE